MGLVLTDIVIVEMMYITFHLFFLHHSSQKKRILRHYGLLELQDKKILSAKSLLGGLPANVLGQDKLALN